MVDIKRLSDVADVRAGHTFRGKAEDQDRSEGVRLIQIKDVREDGEPKELPFAAVDESRVGDFLRDGDILFPLRGGRIEAMEFRGFDGGRAITTNQVAVIRAKSGVLIGRYLVWYFNSEEGRRSISGYKVGSVVSNIGLRELSGVPIPVPSIDVQSRVVRVYENWMARKKVLEEMLIVGGELSGRVCFDLVEGV